MATNKFDSNENPHWDPDALVEVTFTAKDIIVNNAYRPHYKILGDYLTTTFHWFIENGVAQPKEATRAFVKFITPEAYPSCLEAGMIIEVREASMIVGEATIIEVYNEILHKLT